jgi:hypothetical protein
MAWTFVWFEAQPFIDWAQSAPNAAWQKPEKPRVEEQAVTVMFPCKLFTLQVRIVVEVEMATKKIAKRTNPFMMFQRIVGKSYCRKSENSD